MTYALYILARTIRTSTGRTRHEAWFGTPPSFDRLRVFGSTAYAHNPKHKKHQSKSVPCWSMCPAEDAFGKKAYRLVDKRNPLKVVFSRNVVFDEDWTMRTKGSARSGSSPTAAKAPPTRATPVGVDMDQAANRPGSTQPAEAQHDLPFEKEETPVLSDVDMSMLSSDEPADAGVLSEDEMREEEEESRRRSVGRHRHQHRQYLAFSPPTHLRPLPVAPVARPSPRLGFVISNRSTSSSASVPVHRRLHRPRRTKRPSAGRTGSSGRRP
jgi:hypothetical protein